jgi:hypothetical protein
MKMLTLRQALSSAEELLDAEVRDGRWEIRLLDWAEDGGLSQLYEAAGKYQDLCS